MTAPCSPDHRWVRTVQTASNQRRFELATRTPLTHADKDTWQMSVVASPPRKSPRPRKGKGEGQWALGYREPLNKNEENKKFDDGLNVRQRIIDAYSKRGFDSIAPDDRH